MQTTHSCPLLKEPAWTNNVIKNPGTIYLSNVKNRKTRKPVLLVSLLVGGHPHSTYGQRGGEGSSQIRTTAYKWGGEGGSSLRTYANKKTKKTGPQNLKTFLFFVQKKPLQCQLLLRVEKRKSVLSYK